MLNSSASLPVRSGRRLFATAAALLLLARAASAAPADDLLAAARNADAAAVHAAIAAGAPVDTRGRDKSTALHVAASKGDFAAVRLLLWAGANPALTDAKGRRPLDLVPADADEARALQLILRAYAYLRETGLPRISPAKNPELVMILEDAVNYLHPKLKAAYAVNTAELNGKPGVDDDKNGFVDDVYGWNPYDNAPYVIGSFQLEAYQKNREVIARLLKIDADRHDKKITRDEAARLLRGYTNPLAQILGPQPEINDGNFLNMLKSAAHGSHVAGIVVDNSAGKARLHTLNVPGYSNSSLPFGDRSEAIILPLVESATSLESFLGSVRARLLEDSRDIGRIYSRYIAITGAGVANLSFGYDLESSKETASFLIKLYKNVHETAETVKEGAASDESNNLAEEIEKALVEHWGFEIYLAQSVRWGLMFYENPDVLFVCAAGNDDKDNDQTLQSPAYYARFFNNVITVASVNQQDAISSFSNYGRKSVTIAARGEDILSTVIPEADVYMQGTSMAAPAVAGAAALYRSLAPKTRAAEVRRLLEYTITGDSRLSSYVATAGVLDPEDLRALVDGTPRRQINALANMAITAAKLDPAEFPRARADGDAFTQKAIQLDETYSEAWRGRAVFFDLSGKSREALPFAEKALQLAPNLWRNWTSRASIELNLSENAAAAESLANAVRVARADKNVGPGRVASLLAWQAEVLVSLDRKDDAKKLLVEARSIDGDLALSEELEALLK